MKNNIYDLPNKKILFGCDRDLFVINLAISFLLIFAFLNIFSFIFGFIYIIVTSVLLRKIDIRGSDFLEEFKAKQSLKLILKNVYSRVYDRELKKSLL